MEDGIYLAPYDYGKVQAFFVQDQHWSTVYPVIRGRDNGLNSLHKIRTDSWVKVCDLPQPEERVHIRVPGTLRTRLCDGKQQLVPHLDPGDDDLACVACLKKASKLIRPEDVSQD